LTVARVIRMRIAGRLFVIDQVSAREHDGKDRGRNRLVNRRMGYVLSTFSGSASFTATG
jgi:hypothetical protein